MELVAPGRLRIREGGGCLSLFGLPFFGAGVLVTLIALGVVSMSNEGEVPWFVWPLMLLMGLVFTGVGGTLVFGRSWTTLDATARVVSKEWGLLTPMRARTQPLDGYTTVRLGFKQGDSDTADQFPVSLRSSSRPHLSLFNSGAYSEARTCAIAVAKHLQLDIEDATTDHPIRLSSEQADLPLQGRLRGERQATRVERPPDARSDVREDGDGLHVVILSTRAHPLAIGVTLLPAAVPLLLFGSFVDFFRQTRTPDLIGWIFLGFLVFGFGVLPASVALSGWVRGRVGHTTVTVSSSAIDIRERGAWRTRTIASIPASDILDVDYSTRESITASATREAEAYVVVSGQSVPDVPPIGPRTARVLAWLTQFAKGRGVTIRSRQGLTHFAQGLADDEIRYLHDMVRRALAQPPDGR